jgi:membrane peptidoglycan carboxypeptidase
VWFVGYTPELTAAVWIGRPSAVESVILDGSYQTGGNYPARIWRAFMSAALALSPPSSFAPANQALWPPGGFITEAGRSTQPPPSQAPSVRKPRPPTEPERRSDDPEPRRARHGRKRGKRDG